MDEVRTRAVERLRDRGLPQTTSYIENELERMQLEINRKQARKRGEPRPSGAMPRAIPDQVMASATRDEKGRIQGRYAGAVATAEAEKEVWSEKQERDVIKPTLAGATFQMDLIDAKNMGSEEGYGMVAIDVATRKVYGSLMNGKQQMTLFKPLMLL